MVAGLFIGLAALLVAGTVGIIRAEDKYRGNQVPPQISIVKWFNCNRHWHSFGHVMLEVALTFLVGVVILSLFKVSYFKGLALFFAVPSIVLTLVKEIIIDGHWRFFVGKDPEWLDFLFDCFTHFAGAAFAVLLFQALLSG